MSRAAAGQSAIISRWSTLLWVGCTTMGALSGYLLTHHAPAYYRAECLLDYGREPAVFGEPAASGRRQPEWYHTQDFLVVSRPVVEGAVEQLETKDSFFIVPRNESRSSTAERLRGRLHVARVDKTQLTRLSFDDVDASRAARIVNAIAEAYLVKAAEDRMAASERALGWLSEQAADARRRLEVAEGEIELYLDREPATPMPLHEQQQVLSEQAKQVNQRLVETRLRRIELSAQVAKLKHASESHDPFSVHTLEVDQNDQAKQLRSAYMMQFIKLQTLEASHEGPSQELALANSQLAAIRDQMAQVVGGIQRTLQAELTATQQVEAQLQATAAQLNEQGRALQRQQLEYGRLAREREHLESLLDTLRERSAAAGWAKATAMTGSRIVEPARAPDQPLPAPHARNVLLGALSGLTLGALIHAWRRRVSRQGSTNPFGPAVPHDP